MVDYLARRLGIATEEWRRGRGQRLRRV